MYRKLQIPCRGENASECFQLDQTIATEVNGIFPINLVVVYIVL